MGDFLSTQVLSSGAFAFMLVVCRCASAVMLLPALGESDPPPMLRAGIAFALAALLTPALSGELPPVPHSFLRLAGLIAGELLAGGVLGWLARLIALALAATGQIMSLATGLSSVLQQDPLLGAQSSALGRVFSLAAPVVILSTGLYALPLTALAGSYHVFPAGGMLPPGDLAETALRAVTASFGLALRLASPFLLISLLWQSGLGLLSRLVPHIQVYFAAMPAQILGGLLLLALLGGGIVTAWFGATQEAFSALP
jgi:flagellar biosynthetic protein FliR